MVSFLMVRPRERSRRSLSVHLSKLSVDHVVLLLIDSSAISSGVSAVRIHQRIQQPLERIRHPSLPASADHHLHLCCYQHASAYLPHDHRLLDDIEK